MLRARCACVGTCAARSVYELLQALQEEVLVAIGTGRGKLDASPLGVMQAVWVSCGP